MSDFLKKALLVGLGATALVEEAVEEIVKNLAKRGEVTTEEARKIAHSLVAEARKDLESAQQKGVEGVDKFLAELNITSKKEFDALEKRVSALEKAIEKPK